MLISLKNLFILLPVSLYYVFISVGNSGLTYNAAFQLLASFLRIEPMVAIRPLYMRNRESMSCECSSLKT